MTKTPKPSERDELLASEFALGVLNGKKLEKVKARLASDMVFRGQVEKWQSHLFPMLDEVEEVTPPAQSWNNLENRLFGESTPASGWLSSLSFWRGFSFASSALAALLIAVIFLRPDLITPSNSNNNNLVAALNLAEGKPTFIIQMDKTTGQLRVQSANFTDEAARVPELWLIPEDGVPRSLGVISANNKSRLSIGEAIQSLFKSGATLAVSLEPKGGAPEGKPTGPIVAAGKLLGI